MQTYINIKTGDPYLVISDEVTDSTNERDGNRVVLYMNLSGKLFVRDYEEFLTKFYRQ